MDHIKQTQKFPYLELFAILLASMVATAGIFWGWHFIEIKMILSGYEKQNAALRTEITTLERYVATLGTTTKSTIK